MHLLDFEDSCFGPRQWDVAYVIGSWRLGWLTDDEFDQFVAAYGDDLRNDADIDLLVDISLFRRTCWYASRASREPQIVGAVRHRIATLLGVNGLLDHRVGGRVASGLADSSSGSGEDLVVQCFTASCVDCDT
ncbi:hypothetical protein [Catellatospora sp. NPDC049609]|uniref:phosphotransferase family protein n=1 Tax=Catellatospora sp. NPDC049609 TaxID=3155505 RepID=UPI00342CB707